MTVNAKNYLRFEHVMNWPYVRVYFFYETMIVAVSKSVKIKFSKIIMSLIFYKSIITGQSIPQANILYRICNVIGKIN